MAGRKKALLLTSIIILGACSHPIMKDEGESPQQKPDQALQIRDKQTESKSDKTQLGEVFDSDEVRFLINEAEWKKISDEDGIQAYQRREGKNPYGDVVAFRGETVIPARLVKIATILNDSMIQKEWVDSLDEARIFDRRSKFESLGYNKTSVPWPFQDRDFVFKANVQVQINPPVMLIKMKSIEDAREPPRDGVVRGEILISYFYMKELPGNRTQMVIEMALDPKGAIPLWLVNSAQKKWPHNTLKKLREVSTNEMIPVSKEIEDFFMSKPTSTIKGKKK